MEPLLIVAVTPVADIVTAAAVRSVVVAVVAVVFTAVVGGGEDFVARVAMDVVPFGCGDTRGGGVVDVDVGGDDGSVVQVGDVDVIDGVAVVAIVLSTVPSTVVATAFSADMTEGCSLSWEAMEGSESIMPLSLSSSSSSSSLLLRLRSSCT